MYVTGISPKQNTCQVICTLCEYEKATANNNFIFENFVRVIRLKRCAICKNLLRNDFLPPVFSHVSSRIILKDREVLFILAISLLSRIVRIDDSWS